MTTRIHPRSYLPRSIPRDQLVEILTECTPGLYTADLQRWAPPAKADLDILMRVLDVNHTALAKALRYSVPHYLSHIRHKAIPDDAPLSITYDRWWIFCAACGLFTHDAYTDLGYVGRSRALIAAAAQLEAHPLRNIHADAVEVRRSTTVVGRAPDEDQEVLYMLAASRRSVRRRLATEPQRGGIYTGHAGPFAGFDLSGAVFDDLDLSGADFRKSLLRDASFFNCDLSGAWFGGTQGKVAAVLYGARFHHCELSRADFNGCELAGTFFEGGGKEYDAVDFTGAGLELATLNNCSFYDSSLVKTRLHATVLRNTTFGGDDLSEIYIRPGKVVLLGASGIDLRQSVVMDEGKQTAYDNNMPQGVIDMLGGGDIGRAKLAAWLASGCEYLLDHLLPA